jgi:hypothetical protein
VDPSGNGSASSDRKLLFQTCVHFSWETLHQPLRKAISIQSVSSLIAFDTHFRYRGVAHRHLLLHHVPQSGQRRGLQGVH